MKTPDQLTAALLDQTVDALLKIYLLRGECSAAARTLLKRNQRNHLAAEDCAKLDDALASVYRSLQATVRTIQRSRGRKRRRA